MKTTLIFKTEQGSRDVAYNDLQFPRVPTSEDYIRFPDDVGLWRVDFVTFDYSEGIDIEPIVVIEMLPAAPQSWTIAKP